MAARNSVIEKKAPAGEPRPKSKPQKNPLPVQSALLEPVLIRTTRDVIEVNESQSKSHQIVMSITESSSEIHKPKSYKEAVNDSVYRRQ